MSTTTERSPLRRFGRLSTIAAAILAGWFVALVAVTAAAQPTETVMVLAPRSAALHAMEATGASLVGEAGPFLHLLSKEPGFVRDLYRAGAWLVLPAPMKGGCFFLPGFSA